MRPKSRMYLKRQVQQDRSRLTEYERKVCSAIQLCRGGMRFSAACKKVGGKAFYRNILRAVARIRAHDEAKSGRTELTWCPDLVRQLGEYHAQQTPADKYKDKSDKYKDKYAPLLELIASGWTYQGACKEVGVNADSLRTMRYRHRIDHPGDTEHIFRKIDEAIASRWWHAVRRSGPSAAAPAAPAAPATDVVAAFKRLAKTAESAGQNWPRLSDSQPKQSIRIYMAGPVDDQPDLGRKWRTAVRNGIVGEGHTPVWPSDDLMRVDMAEPGADLDSAVAIALDRWQSDNSKLKYLRAIKRLSKCDAIAVYADGAGPGTEAEFKFARWANIPVVVIRNQLSAQDLVRRLHQNELSK